MRNVVCCLICLFKIMVERLYCLFKCFEFVCKNDGLMSGGWVVFLKWNMYNLFEIWLISLLLLLLFVAIYLVMIMLNRVLTITHWWSGFLFFFFWKKKDQSVPMQVFHCVFDIDWVIWVNTTCIFFGVGFFIIY